MIKPVEEIDRTEWQRLVDTSAFASFFQSPSGHAFFASLSFLESFGWGIYDGGGVLKALLCGYITPISGGFKRAFSRRAIIHGGLLPADDAADELVDQLLSHAVKALSDRVIYIEIRNGNDYTKYRTIFEKNKFVYQAHLNYWVDTTNAARVSERYSESKLRQIRKAYACGAVCETAARADEIAQFYEILHRLYRQKVKKPLFPKEFFEKLVLHPHCLLFVVKKGEKVVGGIACATLPGKAVYELFVCGDTQNFNMLYPSVVATHRGIEFAAQNGFAYFDMMGAGRVDESYGVREFKSRFGGKLVEHGRYICVCRPCLYRIGRFVIACLTGKK